jgi:hypothetical protein
MKEPHKSVWRTAPELNHHAGRVPGFFMENALPKLILHHVARFLGVFIHIDGLPMARTKLAAVTENKSLDTAPLRL